MYRFYHLKKKFKICSSSLVKKLMFCYCDDHYFLYRCLLRVGILYVGLFSSMYHVGYHTIELQCEMFIPRLIRLFISECLNFFFLIAIINIFLFFNINNYYYYYYYHYYFIGNILFIFEKDFLFVPYFIFVIIISAS